MTAHDDLPCIELVELVTDYLEGALSPPERARFEAHLAICEDCVTYVEQVRRTVEAAGVLPPEGPPPAVREALLAAFRELRRLGDRRT